MTTTPALRSPNPATRLTALLALATRQTYGAHRDLCARAQRQAASGWYADVAGTLALVDGLPTETATLLEQALSDLGVDLT